jgi:hypothetical protein
MVIVSAIIVVAIVAVIGYCTAMPKSSYTGPLPPLTPEKVELQHALQSHVEEIAGRLGEHNVDHPEQLEAAARYIESQLATFGYTTRRQAINKDMLVFNIETEFRGSSKPDEIVVIAAHYDSVIGTVGANDNTSGVAALLELARFCLGRHFPHTLRFVFFVNEEPPWFRTSDMGSLVYARRSRARNENIVAMLSLETIGYYSNHPNSQRYPAGLGLFYPDRGNFIAFVGNIGSARLLRRSISSFRSAVQFPSVGAVVPESVPGAGWSDHWSFWQEGYPAIMVTDTAIFRYPYYHLASDTPDKIDYESMARVVSGLGQVLENLVEQ